MELLANEAPSEQTDNEIISVCRLDFHGILRRLNQNDTLRRKVVIMNDLSDLFATEESILKSLGEPQIEIVTKQGHPV